MKKLLLLFFCSLSAFGQQDNYAAFAAGSDVNGHLIGQFTMVSKNIELSINFDHFPKLDYSRYSFGLGYHFPLYSYPFGNELKTTFIPSIEPSLIDRTGNWGGGLKANEPSSHLTVALNLALQWDLSETFALQAALCLVPRSDLKAKYDDDKVSRDGFIKIIYKVL